LIKTQFKKFAYQKYSYIEFLANNLKSLNQAFRAKTFYSDFGEDILIAGIMPHQDITYLDIGSGHPIIGNNTYHFYRSGLRGVTVEPIKFHTYLHRLVRVRDIQIDKIISDANCKTKFYEFNPTQYSTMSTLQFEHLTSKGFQARRIYDVESESINTIVDLLPKKPFFISIDCEGYDVEVLRQLDPKKLESLFAVIIERPNNFGDSLGIDKLMKNLNLKLFGTTNNNLIYRK